MLLGNDPVRILRDETPGDGGGGAPRLTREEFERQENQRRRESIRRNYGAGRAERLRAQRADLAAPLYFGSLKARVACSLHEVRALGRGQQFVDLRDNGL